MQPVPERYPEACRLFEKPGVRFDQSLLSFLQSPPPAITGAGSEKPN